MPPFDGSIGDATISKDQIERLRELTLQMEHPDPGSTTVAAANALLNVAIQLRAIVPQIF